MHIYIHIEREYWEYAQFYGIIPRLGGITSPITQYSDFCHFSGLLFPPPLSAFPPFFLSVMLSTPNSSPCMMKTITTLPLRSSHPLIMLTPQNSHSFFLQECHSLFSCPCYSYKYFLHCLWKVQSEKNFWEQRAVENNWAVSPKVKYRITGWLSNSILSMFFRRNNYTFPQKRIHTWMFIVTNRWKQPKFSSTDDRYIKHDVATQRNIIQPWKGTKRW